MNLIKLLCSYLGGEISRYISYCSHCDIIQEMTQVNQISELELGEKVYFEGASIESFLELCDIPKKYHEQVLPYLHCNECGYGYDEKKKSHPKGVFDNSILLFNEGDIDEYLNVDMSDWYEFTVKYGIQIKSFEIVNFLTTIKKSPLLAYRHYVGVKLFDLLSLMYEHGDYLLLKNKKLFRGRKRMLGTEKYEENQMWEPPFGVSTHGRYNIIGTSVLYLTDDIKYVPYEVNLTSEEELDIATIKITQQLKILDLSNFMGDFGRFLSESPHDLKTLKFEYLLSNYISDCCKEIGFNGIKYMGVKKGNYNNYALINFDKKNELEIVAVDNVKVGIRYRILE
ncbi:hypothetical protein [Paenibacillus sp. FSL K6-2859]|uniref:hypothetical protein n=1 Tax=Paenibacillus sp. FSL K6-2859 TaxID=2921482 RepID=UPI0030FA743E